MLSRGISWFENYILYFQDLKEHEVLIKNVFHF